MQEEKDMKKQKLPRLKPSFCRFYLFRHGETEANATEIVQGHLNSDLTENGKEKALQRAQDIVGVEFAHIFSSDLLRTKQTADILKQEREVQVQMTELLRERYYGKFEGATFSEYRATMASFLEEKERMVEDVQYEYRLAGEVESDRELFERSVRFFRETAVLYPSQNILVVSHGGVMRNLLTYIGYIDRKTEKIGHIENVAYCVVDCDGVEFFVRMTEGIEKKNIE